ncbi:hypothetical protein Syun_019569 [Stephania yunnanensis]|uniref:Pentatricopeptide repeat (PPR) superfamily protein n=1 Tax=Stephania yunnanensis TaxID=152371 RepID=A0AAP0IWD0_9MAGN
MDFTTLILFCYHFEDLVTLSHTTTTTTSNNNAFMILLISRFTRRISLSSSSFSSRPRVSKALASGDGESEEEEEESAKQALDLDGDGELVRRISGAKDAEEVLEVIAERCEGSGGVVCVKDCCRIIGAAIERNNAQLACSVYSAMNSSFDQGLIEASSIRHWKWARPNVDVYSSLICGLATSLRVSDAIKVLNDVCRVGVSSIDEVPFGKVVRCPSCTMAIAVAQPQHGIQVVSCSKCRYQYELFSGDIVSIDSEEISSWLCGAVYLLGIVVRSPPTERSMDIPVWERGLRFLQIMKQSIPAAVHSVVVQTPSGTARTHRFATKTVELPAQEGERVTISLAAPSNVYREVGPLRFNTRSPGFKPGEPMGLTNHVNGRESQLLRAPVKNGSLSLLNPAILFPVLALLATGDVASGIIDPSLPKAISIAAVASVTLGTTLNSVVLPQLNRLPQSTADVIAIKQLLLSQYDMLQTRIKDLREAAEEEVWMLARMCQLDNKILAVGEPSYRARRSRIQRVRETLERSLKAHIELIYNYARISSMIEIEVEMDSNVLAAEAASSAETIAEQIKQTMELENLEQQWRMQAEVNDEVERLLSSQPVPTEQI